METVAFRSSPNYRVFSERLTPAAYLRDFHAPPNPAKRGWGWGWDWDWRLVMVNTEATDLDQFYGHGWLIYLMWHREVGEW